MCVENDLKSVAFGCISTGVFHFPNKRIFEISEANRKAKCLEVKVYDYMVRFEKNFPAIEAIGSPMTSAAVIKYLDFLRRINCHSARRKNESYWAVQRLMTTQQMAI